MKEITRQWLNAAHDDLQVIDRVMSDAGLTNMVAFHAQQSIEKSVKAYIEEMGLYLPKTHDLLRLLRISTLDLLDEETEVIEELNYLYLNTRYPAELGLLPEGKPSQDDAELFRKTAQRIHAKVTAICT